MLLWPAGAVRSAWGLVCCCVSKDLQLFVTKQAVSKPPEPSGLSSDKKHASLAVSLDLVFALPTYLLVFAAVLPDETVEASRTVAAS